MATRGVSIFVNVPFLSGHVAEYEVYEDEQMQWWNLEIDKNHSSYLGSLPQTYDKK